MRIVIALAIALAFVLLENGQRQSPKHPGNQKQIRPAEQQAAPSPAVTVLQQKNATDQHDSSEQNSETYFHRLIRADNLPNILLFFAGLGGIAVGVYTLRDIRRQTGFLGEYVAATKNSTEAMEKSVRLQEVQMRQWVHTENWKATVPPFSDRHTEASVKINFDVVNPTAMPLALKSISTKAGVIWGETPEFAEMGLDYVLPPNNRFPVEIAVILRGQHCESFKKQAVGLTITSEVVFEDVFGGMRRQSFGYTCHCKRDGWYEFKVYEGRMSKEGAIPDVRAQSNSPN